MAQAMAGVLPIAVGGFLVATPLIDLVYGAEYSSAALPLSILVWSLPVALIRNVAQAAMLAYSRQREMMHTAAWAGGANILLNLALIPTWGLAGAAASTLVTELLRTVLALVVVHRLGVPMTSPGRFARIIVAVTCMAVAVTTLDRWGVIVHHPSRRGNVCGGARRARRDSPRPWQAAGVAGMTPRLNRDSFVGTFMQSIPRLPTLISQMRPTWHLPSLDAVDAGFVEAHGIRGIVWDVDGTITEHHATEVAPAAAAGFRGLLALPSLRHVILSNADERRFVELGRLFPSIPILRGYRTAAGIAFRRVLGPDDSWSGDLLASRLADGATPLRKPSAELIGAAVAELGCEAASTVMIGDQYLTDVAGAGLGGVRSVKLPTLGRPSFPLARPGVQLLESASTACGTAPRRQGA